MPGSGMAISVKPINTEKVRDMVASYYMFNLWLPRAQPHIFGAILNRDEVLTRIMDHGIKMSYLWATSPSDTNNNNNNNNQILTD